MGITANGYEITPKEDILKEVQAAFREALGSDLVLDAETPQGQLISYLTNLLWQIDRKRQDDFFSRDIYRAQGLQLDIIGRELGLPRTAAIPTQVQVLLKGAINYEVPEGTLANVITDSSQTFEFTAPVMLTQAEQYITLTAADSGVYDNLVVGTQLQTQEYTPQIYDMKITNIIHGTAAESDYSYRIRLVEAQAANVDEVEHLTIALRNTENVLAAYVEPNNTLETSASGIPPHAVEIVVLGGAEADIAKVLLGYIFATPTYKDPTLGVEITGLDYNRHYQKFYITRPEKKSVNITVQYKNKPGQTLSTENIEFISNKIKELVNSTVMNKTLYKSDVCALATDGFTSVYYLENLAIEVAGVEIGTAYTCTAREYLDSADITFTEVK